MFSPELKLLSQTVADDQGCDQEAMMIFTLFEAQYTYSLYNAICDMISNNVITLV